jgi:fructokinase
MTAVDVVVIGDCLIDEVQLDHGAQRYPGGAGLNVAAHLARLGAHTGLIAMVGTDEDGRLLVDRVERAGVRVLAPSSGSLTGLATSVRINGEPRYLFNEAVINRRIPLDAVPSSVYAEAQAVVVSSFPFDDGQQVDALEERLRLTTGLVVVDPNPRSALLNDGNAFVANLQRILPLVDVLKVSTDDTVLLGADPAAATFEAFHDMSAVVDSALAVGVRAVFATFGAAGAELSLGNGLHVRRAVVDLPGPVIDTMGAGDASLAAVVARLAAAHGAIEGLSRSELSAILEFAMREAAIVCRAVGAAPMLGRLD